MNRFLLPLVAALVLLLVFYVGLQRDPSVLPSQYIGKQAPEFNLPGLTDPANRLSNEDLVGQISLLNVWATWCVGCRAEHEFLNALAMQGELPIFGLNWRDNRRTALEWLQTLGNPYRKSGFDEDGKAGIDWGVYGAPETYLIAPDGTVVFRFAGPLDGRIWQTEFLPRIEELSR